MITNVRLCLAVALLALATCNENDDADSSAKQASRPVPAKPAPAKPAPPNDAAAPAQLVTAKGPVGGKLAGVAFTPKKIVLRLSPTSQSLEMYAKSQGGRCQYQFAPRADDLYVTVRAGRRAERWKPGFARLQPEHVTTTYKKPNYEYVEEHLELAIDSIDDAGKSATGRIVLTAKDGTEVRGAFRATLCRSRETERASAEPIYGIDYGKPIDPKQLPKRPLKGVHLAKPFQLRYAEVVRYRYPWGKRQRVHIIQLFSEPPKRRCADTMLVDGFRLRLPLGDTLVPGAQLSSETSARTSGGRPFAALVWKTTGGGIGTNASGRMSYVIDQVGDRVRGRVGLWFDDPGKSFVVGQFDAALCPMSTE